MNLNKRGLIYHVDLTDETGRRLRVTTGEREKRAATAVGIRLQQEINERRGDSSAKGTVTLADATARYVDRLLSQGKSSAPHMVSLRLKALGQHPGLRDAWGLPPGLMLHDLTADLLDTLVTRRQSEGSSPQTIAHEIKMLRAATRYAVSLDRRGPTLSRWPIPTLTEKTRYLSRDEYGKLLAELDPSAVAPHLRDDRVDARDLVVALAMTGARWSEITGLRWSQMDPPEFTRIRLWGNKTQKERQAPVPAALRAVLARRWATGSVNALVFPSPTGREREGSNKPILRAIERAGLNDPEIVRRHGRATVHTLRHTFASWVRQSGAGLDEVQDLLGHTTMQMTRRYARLNGGETAARAAAALDKLDAA